MLSTEVLRGLEAHKYSCAGKSMIEPVFQIYWTWLVELMPLWLAPNLITFLGLLCNIVGSVALFWYCPTLTEAAPGWSYVMAAVTLFIYQSLDAVDGKQARRTKSSSPLGELFDHGCDALSGAFLILTTLCVLRVGDQPALVFTSLLAQLAAFYSAHWRAYTTGTLQFGYIDVTEAQLAMMLVSLSCWAFGPDLWLNSVQGYSFNTGLLYCVDAMTFAVVLNNCRHAFLARNAGHCRADGWYTPVISYTALLFTMLGVLWVSPGNIAVSSPLLVGLLYGVISAQIASRLVVAHMSRTPMVLYDLCLFPIQAVLLNALLGAPLSEYWLIAACLLLATVNLFVTASIMCREIASHMGIYVFTIGKRVD